MTLSDINKAIAKCNPYTQKTKLRYLTGLRRKLERVNKSVNDAMSGNVPDMLKRQSGL